MTTPEEHARQRIDALLAAAGWAVQDFKAADLTAARWQRLRALPVRDSAVLPHDMTKVGSLTS